MTIPEGPLHRLNAEVAAQLSSMPVTDPATLSTDTLNCSDSDLTVRRILDRVCRHADAPARERMHAEYFGAGPIEALLADSQITEIILNGGDCVWFEKQGRLERWHDGFLSELTYRNFISRVCRDARIQASLDCPFADGRWRDCRVHLIIPPASGDQAVMTLRRHSDSPWTFERLLENKWASQQALAELRDIVQTKKNFLIVGGTGSGKTSVLNACLWQIADNERTLLIEDTSELRIPNKVSSKLLTRRDHQGILKEIDQTELLKQALRMRPDRLVLGEIRGGEAKDLLMAFSTGHAGCIGTLHADSARQALLRLEMLVQMGAPQWSLNAVRTLIWLSLHAIVVVGRTASGERRLDGIFKIVSLEDCGFLIERISS